MEGRVLVLKADEKEGKMFEIIDGLGIMLQESVDRIVEDVYNIPEKIAESLVNTADEFVENRETVVILGLAALGATLMVGRVVCKIPIPSAIDKRLVAPVIAVLIVRSLAKSAEGRLACG